MGARSKINGIPEIRQYSINIKCPNLCTYIKLYLLTISVFFCSSLFALAFNQFSSSIYNCVNFTSGTHSTKAIQTTTKTYNEPIQFLVQPFYSLAFLSVIGLLFSKTLKSFKSRAYMKKKNSIHTVKSCRLFHWTTRQREWKSEYPKKVPRKVLWILRYWMPSSLHSMR